MSRTKGSGWGGGTLLYQICPYCGKKKVIFQWIEGDLASIPFKCTACLKRFSSDTLLRYKYVEHYKRCVNGN
jgi:hypothetical protein